MTTWGGLVLLSIKIGMRPELFFVSLDSEKMKCIYAKDKRDHWD